MDPDAARDAARGILDGSKYQDQRLPRPFKGILEWIADRLRPVVEAVEDVLEPVIGFILGLPGGRFVFIGLVVLVLAVVIRWLIGRRSRSAVTVTTRGGLVDLSSDPAALEADADRAESDGDHQLAVRYRYEAGLLRLVRAGRLELRPETTPASAARQVAAPAMDRLTADFEEVVYGGRPATEADSRRARGGWAELLAVRSSS